MSFYPSVLHFFFQFLCQFFMIYSLLFPKHIKLIQIILAIEYHISQARIGILIQHFHLILPDSLFIKVQLLTPITDCAEITA